MKVKVYHRCTKCRENTSVDIHTRGIFKKVAYNNYHDFLCDDCANEKERKQRESHEKHIKEILDKEAKCHHEWHALDSGDRGSYLKCPKCGKTIF